MIDAVHLSQRPATEDDIARLAELHVAGQEAVHGERGGELDTLLLGRSAPIETSFADDLVDPASTVLVGQVDGLTVGYVVGRVSTLTNGDRLMTVADLFVDPDARGVGVGRLLLDQLVTAAEADHCRGIDARALPGDRGTKNFVESFGLVARSFEVHKDLR